MDERRGRMSGQIAASRQSEVTRNPSSRRRASAAAAIAVCLLFTVACSPSGAGGGGAATLDADQVAADVDVSGSSVDAADTWEMDGAGDPPDADAVSDVAGPVDGVDSSDAGELPDAGDGLSAVDLVGVLDAPGLDDAKPKDCFNVPKPNYCCCDDGIKGCFVCKDGAWECGPVVAGVSSWGHFPCDRWDQCGGSGGGGSGNAPCKTGPDSHRRLRHRRCQPPTWHAAATRTATTKARRSSPARAALRAAARRVWQERRANHALPDAAPVTLEFRHAGPALPPAPRSGAGPDN